MGMMACYMEAEEVLLNRLNKDTGVNLFEELEKMEGETDSFQLDKMWDGLHFLLTGVSACSPIEGNLLSEAIVGTDTFPGSEDGDYIAFIYPDRVLEIAKELDRIKIEEVLPSFSPEAFAQKDIYPDIWLKEDKEALKEELGEYFEYMKEYYGQTAKKGKGIIVSIY